MIANPLQIQLPDLPKKLEEMQIGTFIFSVSYEGRCLKIAGATNGQTFKKVFVCYNKKLHSIVLKEIESAKEIFADCLSQITLNNSDPIDTIDAIIKSLVICAEEQSHVLVDITCFTHESLLILQKVIKHLKLKATYAYCPAKEYNPQTQNDKDKWLSRGIGEVRSVLGYPGARNPLKSSHLIVLVGFEVERARKLIDRYEPRHLSLGHAEDEIAKGASERNKKRFQELKLLYPAAKEFKFSTYNIQKTKEAIKNQVKEFDEANPLVAPMNTKISTLALAQAAEEDERIQICYASALIYNVEDYSEASEDCYLFTENST